MKTKAALLIGTVMITVLSCDTNSYTENDRLEAMNELNNYVDSVEVAVEMLPTHDWTKIETRYEILEDSADLIYKDLKIEDQELIMTETRFDLIVEEGKKEEADFRRTSEMHLDNVENWWEEATGTIENASSNTVEDIEGAAKESMAWLEANFDKLGNEAQQEYNKLKEELDKS